LCRPATADTMIHAMKLLAAADIHGTTGLFSEILDHAGPVDLILLAGDLTDFGSPLDAEAVIHVAQANKVPDTFFQVLAVAGNCDSAQIDARLAELGVSVFRRGERIGDVGFLGLSAMPPWRTTMYHFSEEELAEALDAGHRQVADAPRLVVLSHTPPYGTKVDRLLLGRHVGSTALRAFVDRVQPELVVCGHVHEARGVVSLGRTTVVNCGPAAKGYYALIELADGAEPPKVELRRV